MSERSPDLPLPNFIRYCADDLKALYFEGYMAMKPTAGGDEIAQWFWAETAVGQLLRRVRDRRDASDDPRCKPPPSESRDDDDDARRSVRGSVA